MENQTLAFAERTLRDHLALLPEGWGRNFEIATGLSGGGDYSYCVRDGKARFTGSTPGNVLLGVYDYLRSIGFVFLYPGKGGTYVPDLRKPEDLEAEKKDFTASYAHRGICIEGADSLEETLDFIDWLPKNGFNAFFLQFQKPDIFFERWYLHTYNPSLPPEALTRQQLDGLDRQVEEAMALRGIRCHRVGHGWTAQALGFPGTGWHKTDREPEQKDLVALVNGQRRFWKGIPANTNLCYANPEARKRLVDQVVRYAKETPGMDYLHVWLADDFNNVCTCQDCQKTTVSDQYIEILNDVDEALTQAGLPTKIVFLLYQELLYAPKAARLRNPERFCLMFAPISRTFEKAYPTSFTPVEVTPYVRNAMVLPETVEENLTHLYNWQKIFSGDSFFYDYPLGRAHYGDFGYMKIAKTLYDDIHALKTFRSNGYMSCQELRAMNPTGFPNYVMGLSLLDETIPYETMRKTYFSAMFGPQWEKALFFLEELSSLSSTDYFNNHGPRYQPDLAKNYGKIRELAGNFQIPEGENWEDLRFHCRYTVLLSGALEALCLGKKEEADRRFREFCAFIRSRELERERRLDVFRVIEVAIHYTGFTLPEGE